MTKQTPIKNHKTPGPVWSCNEWDPLEEVIVGNVEGATVPLWSDKALQATTPAHASWFFKKYGGKHFPRKMIDAASKELDNLSAVLSSLGVTVRRPRATDYNKTYATPWWKSKGLYSAMPRDVFMVIGDQIIEAPMAWRNRYFESFAYRDIVQSYFNAGAKWLTAPKSTMDDSFYNSKYDQHKPRIKGKRQFVISENEIAFDAADFMRLGKDIIVQRSNVTNSMGIEWVRRHIGPEYTIHEFEFGDEHPMHIDTTIVPLAPGKLLINPLWVKKIPSLFKDWDIIKAPKPSKPFDSALYFSSDWLTMNILSVNEKQVIVEETEIALIKKLEEHGFDPVPIPFRNFYPFGGSVHCATTDIRRKGILQSYF
jgi:glycine amidinotransferase